MGEVTLTEAERDMVRTRLERELADFDTVMNVRAEARAITACMSDVLVRIKAEGARLAAADRDTALREAIGAVVTDLGTTADFLERYGDDGTVPTMRKTAARLTAALDASPTDTDTDDGAGA